MHSPGLNPARAAASRKIAGVDLSIERSPDSSTRFLAKNRDSLASASFFRTTAGLCRPGIRDDAEGETARLHLLQDVARTVHRFQAFEPAVRVALLVDQRRAEIEEHR